MTLKSIGAVAAGFVLVFVLSTVTDFILESLHVFPPLSEPQAYTPGMLLLALMRVYRGRRVHHSKAGARSADETCDHSRGDRDSCRHGRCYHSVEHVVPALVPHRARDHGPAVYMAWGQTEGWKRNDVSAPSGNILSVLEGQRPLPSAFGVLHSIFT